MRSTLAKLPPTPMSTPWSRQYWRTKPAAAEAGTLSCGLHQLDADHQALARTWPISGCSFIRPSKRALSAAPLVADCWTRPVSSKKARLASDAAHETGLPPKVER